MAKPKIPTKNNWQIAVNTVWNCKRITFNNGQKPPFYSVGKFPFLLCQKTPFFNESEYSFYGPLKKHQLFEYKEESCNKLSWWFYWINHVLLAFKICFCWRNCLNLLSFSPSLLNCSVKGGTERSRPTSCLIDNLW